MRMSRRIRGGKREGEDRRRKEEEEEKVKER